MASDNNSFLSSSSGRILIVEDDPNLRTLMQEQLDREGFDVSVAENGDAGKFMMKLEEVDLVISDIRMPKVNGLELAKFIKSKKPVPVILVTGDAGLVSSSILEEIGADEVLEKPFTKEMLISTVRKHIFPVK